MKEIATENAVGHVLAHDITQIIRGVTKDARFRKGHVVTEEDIPVLLSLGKEHLYIYENQSGMLHENEAAEILWSMLKNEHIRPSSVKEGKIDAFSEIDGLMQVDSERLQRLNSRGNMIIATRNGNTQVKAGDKLAATRVIPLIISEEEMRLAKEAVGQKPLLTIKPFILRNFGVIATGSEIQKGLIKDTFTPVIEDKLAYFGASMQAHALPGDDTSAITKAIKDMAASGLDLIFCTGGMSVDPDDRTPSAIRGSGAEIISYGSPTIPGAMFLVSYFNGIPVLGLPGCVMYARRTVFDLVLPRIMAAERISASDLAMLGQGGLCLDCETCIFPNCGFAAAAANS